MLDPGLCGQVACIWEASARKPGNVHPRRAFADVSFTDFLLSAAAIAPVLSSAPRRGVGFSVLEAVRATRRVVGTNTNLGIVLLLVPLAAVHDGEDLTDGAARVLDGLGVEDSRLVYEAIRLAAPGGLGSTAEQDVGGEPTQSLRQIMALAADRDLVARQYTNSFAEVFQSGVPAVRAGLERTNCLEGAIIFAHLTLLAAFADTLIARKQGLAEAREASARARSVLDAGWPARREGRAALDDLDAWLRAEGNRRNPGTTADLLTASLFVLLRQEAIPLPAPWPWEFEADDAEKWD
jgi:triphosphoribosyl-dephospho-CoA synthase